MNPFVWIIFALMLDAVRELVGATSILSLF